jgi:hypothetical protein
MSNGRNWLGRDAERTPLNRPRLTTRSTSCGPARDVLERCDVFNTILTIRQDVIVSARNRSLLIRIEPHRWVTSSTSHHFELDHELTVRYTYHLARPHRACRGFQSRSVCQLAPSVACTDTEDLSPRSISPCRTYRSSTAFSRTGYSSCTMPPTFRMPV